MNNKSPLRYPGGKTRACKILDEIFCQYFNIAKFDTIISPFFGGGSFEFYMQNKYNFKIISNDKFEPLYNFWNECKTNNSTLVDILNTKLNTITKDDFTELRNNILDESNKLTKAVMYFIINRCSFSGATLSGGFSLEASKKRFTQSSIDKISKLNLCDFEINNYDFTKFLDREFNDNELLFLDPPYYLGEKSKLYGNNGDLHEQFQHEQLYNIISKKKNWILTYNNHEYIRELYSNFTIIDVNWSYGMNKTKKSSEIIIIG